MASAIEFERKTAMFRTDPIGIEPSDRQRRAIIERNGFRRVLEPEAQVLFM